MIESIEFIDVLDYMRLTDWVFPSTRYIYTKIYDAEYPERAVVNDSGFFAIAPATLIFTLNNDTFLQTLLNPSNDRTGMYSRYIVRAIENDVVFFEGLVVLNQIDEDIEEQKIKFECKDFLSLIFNLKDDICNGKNSKLGHLLDIVVRSNEDCLKFILSFAAFQFFPNTNQYQALPDSLAETWAREINVSDFFVGAVPSWVQSENSGITIIIDDDDISYEYWDFTRADEFRGRLVLYREFLKDDNDGFEWEIKARFYFINSLITTSDDEYATFATRTKSGTNKATYNIAMFALGMRLNNSVNIPNFENNFSGIIEEFDFSSNLEFQSEYKDCNFTPLARLSGVGGQTYSTIKLRRGWVGDQYFTFEAPDIHIGFYLEIVIAQPTPPPVPDVDDWGEPLILSTNYTFSLLLTEFYLVADTHFSSYITYYSDETIQTDIDGEYILMKITAKATGESFGIKHYDVADLDPINNYGSTNTITNYTDWYSFFDRNKKTITNIKADTEYKVKTFADGGGNSTKRIFIDNINWSPIDTAYLPSGRIIEPISVFSERIAYDGYVRQELPVDNDTLQWGVTGDIIYKRETRVFKTVDRPFVVYDLRFFVLFNGATVSGVSGLKTGWHLWRWRLIVRASGGIVIFINQDKKFESGANNTITDYALYNDFYHDEFGSVDVVTDYTVPGIGSINEGLGSYTINDPYQRYYARITDLDWKQEAYNEDKREFNMWLGFEGYIFSNYISWRHDAEMTYLTLIQGILHLNNSSMRCDLNDIYFEGRGLLPDSTPFVVSSTDLNKGRRTRILEEQPNTIYLDSIDKFNAERLRDVISNYYKEQFNWIKKRITFEHTDVFTAFTPDVNDLISYEDSVYRLVKVKKITDGVYDVEGWNLPYKAYGLKKFGDNTIRVYGLKIEGETVVSRIYGLKGL